LYIPNALFNQVVIVNPQRMTHRRIDATIGIRYNDGHLLKDLVQAIDQMLRQHPNVDLRQLTMVHFVKFGTSSLDINIYCFTRATSNPHWRDVQQDILFKALDIIAEHKVQIAFPTVTTHIPDGVSIRGDFRS
jgi:MscS family membrane protein